MKYLAVIDTNILVSYLLTKNRDSSVVKIIELVKERRNNSTSSSKSQGHSICEPPIGFTSR